MPYYLCRIPVPDNTNGTFLDFISDDWQSIVERAKTFDSEGYNVYRGANKIKPGARDRTKDTIDEVDHLYQDIDFNKIDTAPEFILAYLKNLEAPPTSIVFSGGGYQPFWRLREPIRHDDPEFARIEPLLKQMAAHLCADTKPTHVAALMRMPNTSNRKYDPPRLAEIIWDRPGVAYDLDDLQEVFELTQGRPAFPRKPPPTTNGQAGKHETSSAERDGATDVDTRLKEMYYDDRAKGGNIYNTQLDCINALLGRGTPAKDAFEIVLQGTINAIGVSEGRRLQAWKKRLLEMIASFVCKFPEHAGVLPEECYFDFVDGINAGHRMRLRFQQGRGSGWKAKRDGTSWRESTHDGSSQTYEEAKSDTQSSPPQQESKKSGRVRLNPFVPQDEATFPPREWILGKHYQRRVVSATVSPGGTGKTSLELVEAISLVTARDLLGEQPDQRYRVWVHNGEDPLEELYRRVLAICKHFDIPADELVGYLFITSGNEMPLKVAAGYGDLKIDTALRNEIIEQIGAHEIDVAIFDPLVTLHATDGYNNDKMDAVIRIFGFIADKCDCSIEIAAHTRKLAPGSVAYVMEDLRGAASIRDAVRAARILNLMSCDDAGKFGIDEFERLSYFRIDRGKANTAKPAKNAVWRKFENVTLLNGDDVGVVTTWQVTEDAVKDEAARYRSQTKADTVFLQLLWRYENEGRHVTEAVSPRYAPKLFAAEPEAEEAWPGTDQRDERSRTRILKGAMNRLIKDGRVKRQEFTTSNGRRGTKIVPRGGKQQ